MARGSVDSDDVVLCLRTSWKGESCIGEVEETYLYKRRHTLAKGTVLTSTPASEASDLLQWSRVVNEQVFISELNVSA